MSLKSFRIIGVLSLALIGLSLASQPASAQQGWPLNHQTRWWENRSAPSFPNYRPSYSQAPGQITRVDATPAKATTEIQVKVPAQAKIWFDGRQTVQAGPSRSFVSPPLTPGFGYRYAVRAEWKEGNRLIERERIGS